MGDFGGTLFQETSILFQHQKKEQFVKSRSWFNPRVTWFTQLFLVRLPVMLVQFHPRNPTRWCPSQLTWFISPISQGFLGVTSILTMVYNQPITVGAPPCLDISANVSNNFPNYIFKCQLSQHPSMFNPSKSPCLLFTSHFFRGTARCSLLYVFLCPYSSSLTYH